VLDEGADSRLLQGMMLGEGVGSRPLYGTELDKVLDKLLDADVGSHPSLGTM
jgi:hypothetical protein